MTKSVRVAETAEERAVWDKWFATVDETLGKALSRAFRAGGLLDMGIPDTTFVAYDLDGIEVVCAGESVRIPFGADRMAVLSHLHYLADAVQSAARRMKTALREMHHEERTADRPQTVDALRSRMIAALHAGASAEEMVETLWRLTGTPPEALCPHCEREAMAAAN